MSFRISAVSFLDRKKCYEMWVQQRISIYNISKLLAKEGIVNPKTGKNVTPQGIWRAANLYILEFPNIAKSDTVSLFSQHGRILDEGEWGKEMIGRARQFLSRSSYRKFLIEYPEYKQYE